MMSSSGRRQDEHCEDRGRRCSRKGNGTAGFELNFRESGRGGAYMKPLDVAKDEIDWSPAELDMNRRSIYELEFHHSRPFRH